MAQPAPKSQVDLAEAFIHRVREEPVWFAREVLLHKQLPGEQSLHEAPNRSWELDAAQIDIIEAMADVWRKKAGKPTRINHGGVPYISVRSPHGSGKTHTAAILAYIFGTAFQARIVCTAPKLQQLRTRVWGELRKIDARAEGFWRSTHTIHDTAVYWKSVNPDTGKLEENKDWCILAETATHADNMAGHHDRFIFILVEEATGVTEALWPVIFGALSTGEIAILVMISNPTKITGTFANSHLKSTEEANYFRYHINLKNSRRIDRGWVASMERKYGKDSPVVAVRCYGNFPTSDPNQLVALEWIQSALEREFKVDGTQPRTRISVDVADGGEDYSVVTVCTHYQTVRRFRKQKQFSFRSAESPISVALEAEKLWREFGCSAANGDDFVVDSLGVGAGTAGKLLELGYPVVVYKGGESSADPQRWRNRRVQSYVNLRNDLRDGLVCFDETFLDEEAEFDDLLGQLCSIKTKPEIDRVDDLITREQMKADGITSPDRADSCAMQYATQAPRLQTGPNATPFAAQIMVIPSEFERGP